MRLRWWPGAAALAIASAGGYTAYRVAAQPGEPVLVCPAELDVGDRELGEIVTAEFAIENRGTGELRIWGVESDCSCSGLERHGEGGPVGVSQLAVAPGDEVPLAVRMSVRSRPGGAAVSNVMFQTNDPSRPVAGVRVVVPRVSGVHFTPPVISPAEVPVGARVEQVVDVHNPGNVPARVVAVGSSDPERIRARLADGGAGGQPGWDGAPNIGRVAVKVEAGAAGRVAGTVTVRVDRGGKEVEAEVPVEVHVKPPAEVYPPSLEFPRASADGPVYEATCLCRSYGRGPMSLAVVQCPEWARVEVPVGEVGDGAAPIRVRCDPTRDGEAGRLQGVIRLSARVSNPGGDTVAVPVELSITCFEAREGT